MNRFLGAASKAAILSVLGIVVAGQARAVDIVIASGTDQTTKVSLPGIGDTVTVENGASVSTSGVGNAAIEGQATDQTITNSGSLSTSGNISHVISTQGANATVINNGSITTTGTGSYGIHVHNSSINTTVINKSSIVASSIGIDADADNVDVTNTGSISVADVGTVGIYARHDGATISNSGSIITPKGAAILAGGHNATVNLEDGSAIEGELYFDDPATATLNLGKGLDANLTFSAAPGNDGTPATVTAPGSTLVQTTNRVVTIDPTSAFSSGRAVTVIAKTAGSAADNRLARLRQRKSTSQVASAVIGDKRISPTADFSAPDDSAAIWGSIISGHEQNTLAGANYTSNLGGLAAGADWRLVNGQRMGIIAGLSTGTTTPDLGRSSLKQKSAFAGAYGNVTGPLGFIDWSIISGLSSLDSSRTVLNNLAPGGTEEAKASSTAGFISPTLAIGRELETSAGIFTPTLSATYVAAVLGKYDEGTSAGLSVGKRKTHNAALKAQMAFAPTPVELEKGKLSTEYRVGVEQKLGKDDAVNATLMGNAVSLASAKHISDTRAFVGIGINYESNAGNVFFANGEIGHGLKDGISASGNVGFQLKF